MVHAGNVMEAMGYDIVYKMRGGKKSARTGVNVKPPFLTPEELSVFKFLTGAVYSLVHNDHNDHNDSFLITYIYIYK
jgi:hypothetical protein